jgi:hypothetical protein
LIVPNLKDAALKYANDGVPVFPTNPDTKKLLVEGGFYAACTDTEQIERWLTD